MSKQRPPDVTGLLLAWNDGDQDARDALLPLVYQELRALARRSMRSERREHTLQPTAVVHEAYLRLIDQKRMRWRNRAQFYGIASELMRRILVDHARKRLVQKRGGNARRVALDSIDGVADAVDADVLDLDRALDRLNALDARLGRVIELRVFGGLTIKETAAVMGIATGTVINDYKVARAWLFQALTRDDDGEAR